MSLSQKYVLITGCSANGLGAALVDVFLQHDYHVFATLRTPSKAPSHFSTLSNITILALDVVSPTDIASAVDVVKKKTGGRLDVLVNNSGRFEVMPALDTSIKEGKKLFDLNFWAPLAMIQAFAPLLIEARGCVVNVSSVAAVLPLYFQSKEDCFPLIFHHEVLWDVDGKDLTVRDRYLQRLESRSDERERDLASRARSSGRADFDYHDGLGSQQCFRDHVRGEGPRDLILCGRCEGHL